MAEALYQFTDQERALYEKTPLPLLVMQVIDGEYHALLASDEYCKMVGSDRESMLEYLKHHSFGRVYPADVVRLATFFSFSCQISPMPLDLPPVHQGRIPHPFCPLKADQD